MEPQLMNMVNLSGSTWVMTEDVSVGDRQYYLLTLNIAYTLSISVVIDSWSVNLHWLLRYQKWYCDKEKRYV